AEQGGSALGGARRGAADELRQLLQLAKGLPLDDALRAICQIDVGSADLLQLPGEAVRHARKNGAAQDHKLAGSSSREEVRHGTVECADRRVERFVDWRANRNDNGGTNFPPR